jgi:Flp pilus assembly protein TadG
MLKRKEEGQATVLVMLAMSIFLLGAVGVATDGSHLYAQRQMAQAAADAAAQAGIMSIYYGTNGGTLSSSFGTGSSFTCSTTDGKTPCYYARLNGFGGSTSDTVTIDFPTSAPGVTLSGSDPVNLLRATVQRNVSTTFLRLVGSTTLPIKATATAAIVDVLSPIPILVLDPTLQGAFSINGNSAGITITGGPRKSIQVNSNDPTCSVSGNEGNCANTSGFVDLSGAGPSGSGGYFANAGGPSGSYPGTLTPANNYTQPVGAFPDPLASMSGPPNPLGATPAAARSIPTDTISPGNGDCPSNLTALTSLTSCSLYSPGYYANGISLTGVYAIFQPGIYYINHKGFSMGSNSIARMAISSFNSYNQDPLLSGDPLHTGWTSGMMVYNNPGVDGSGVIANKDVISIGANSGQINNHNFVDTNCPSGGNCFIGANGGVLTSAVCSGGTAGNSYYGVLFFQSHTTAASISHTLSGGGGLSIVGTVYLTNQPSYDQSLSLQGTSGSTTKVQGEIIVDALSVGGTAGIAMNLSSIPCFNVRQIALIH